MPRNKIDIGSLKDFVVRRLPRNWILREILLAENEEVDIATFLARMPIWLQLTRTRRGDDT